MLHKKGAYFEKDLLPVAADFGDLFHIWQLVELAANAALLLTAFKASGWGGGGLNQHHKSTFGEVFH